MNDFDFSEHYTGNLLIAVRLPPDQVTPSKLRELLPDSIPVPDGELTKTGLGFGNGPTIVQLPATSLYVYPFVEYESELVVVEPERYVYLPAQLHRVPEVSYAPTWGIEKTGVASSTWTGDGVVLAVLDSGLDFDHPDFIDRVALADRIDLTGTGMDDRKGHGTYCAGIAAGPASPKLTGRYGVASEARLLIGKIFDLEETRCPDYRVLRGICWAAGKGADVISLSWGLPIVPSRWLSKVYELVAASLLLTTETVIVVSTGNGSDRPLHPRPIYHPADCHSVIAVAGLECDLTVWRRSCGTIGGQRVPSLAAPAVNVVSSVPHLNQPNYPYADDDGTSASAAFVSGIAALWAQESGVRGLALRDLVVDRYKVLSDQVEDVGKGLSIAP